jgi:hypothetical protein
VTRRRRFPDAGSLARARAQVLEVLEGGVELPFRDWASLATIWGTGWLPVTRHPSPVAARALRRRLGRLGRLASAPGTLAAAGAGTRVAELVAVRGRCAALPGRPATAELWRAAKVRDDAGSWLVEEGWDFQLTDEEGRRAYVLASEAYLVDAEVLRAGDEVAVYGFLDLIPDRAGIARPASGRGGLAPGLRAGPELPLLVSLIKRYDQIDGPRK